MYMYPNLSILQRDTKTWIYQTANLENSSTHAKQDLWHERHEINLFQQKPKQVTGNGDKILMAE